MKTIFADRCEECKVRPKHCDKQQGERKWCKVCIDRYYRKEKMTPEKADILTLNLVEPLYANATLEDLEPGICEKLLKRESDQDLYLFGLPGRGKTYAMAALIRHYTAEGFKCLRICFDEFLCQVRSTMSPGSKITEWEMTKPLKEIDLLVIDDLGLRSEAETNFAYGTLHQILNKRQERLLPTFILSNKNLTTLRQSFDERIISRLSTALVIEITGDDRRKIK